MDVSLLQLMHVVSDRREMMNLLMYRMAAQEPESFDNFVAYCQDSGPCWREM